MRGIGAGKEIVRQLVRIFFALFFRVTVTGLENVPENGPVLLCANHIGALDMFFIGYRLKRLVHYMAKEELFKNPILALLIRWLGAFPVKRGTGDVGAIKTAYRFLDEGKIVGILPQGTRTRGKDLSKIKVNPGVALIALNKGAPILPVGLKGSYKPFTKVKVAFGEPFRPDYQARSGEKVPREVLNSITGEIMKRIYALVEE